jgi:hypothetical protein
LHDIARARGAGSEGVAGGGRDTIQQSAQAMGREKSALSREVTDLVQENWETASGILK